MLYHLCYENVLHHTDGMEYLSDWTFVLLAAVMGLLASHSLGGALTRPGGRDAGGAADTYEFLAEVTVVLHGVCWSSNILSTAGAWYSFFFFPVCESLEGEGKRAGEREGWMSTRNPLHKQVDRKKREKQTCALLCFVDVFCCRYSLASSVVLSRRRLRARTQHTRNETNERARESESPYPRASTTTRGATWSGIG